MSEIRNKEIGIEFKYLAYQTGGKISGREHADENKDDGDMGSPGCRMGLIKHISSYLIDHGTDLKF